MTELIWSCHYTPGSRRTKKLRKENRIGTCASNARFHGTHQTTLNDGRNIDKVAKVAPTTVILLVLVLVGVVAAAIPPVVTMYERPRRSSGSPVAVAAVVASIVLLLAGFVSSAN